MKHKRVTIKQRLDSLRGEVIKALDDCGISYRLPSDSVKCTLLDIGGKGFRLGIRLGDKVTYIIAWGCDGQFRNVGTVDEVVAFFNN